MNDIKTYREKAKLSQADLAEKCGWNQSRIGMYESGKRRPPLDACRLIVAALNRAGVRCTLDKVFPPEVKAA